MIVQLQGHLFFGNVVTISSFIKTQLQRKKGTLEEPLVVIIDFTLVLGMDSSAAHAIAKLKKTMHKSFNVEISVFVTGSGDGFPCEYALSRELSKKWEVQEKHEMSDKNDADDGASSVVSIGTISVSRTGFYSNLLEMHPSEQVCENLDMALIFAEDMLVERANPTLFREENFCDTTYPNDSIVMMFPDEERYYATKFLKNVCPNADEADVGRLCSYFRREEYFENDVIWKQGTPSTSAKLLISGTIKSFLEGTNTTEIVHSGKMIGELGLVNGIDRLSTVVCISEKAIIFCLSKESWAAMVKGEPRIARLIDEIAIEYLAHRVQHVSNRVFETRCLPI